MKIEEIVNMFSFYDKKKLRELFDLLKNTESLLKFFLTNKSGKFCEIITDTFKINFDGTLNISFMFLESKNTWVEVDITEHLTEFIETINQTLNKKNKKGKQ